MAEKCAYLTTTLKFLSTLQSARCILWCFMLRIKFQPRVLFMVSRNPNHFEFQFPEQHSVAVHSKAIAQVKNKT
jgi:hypothetical protein